MKDSLIKGIVSVLLLLTSLFFIFIIKNYTIATIVAAFALLEAILAVLSRIHNH